MLKRHRKAFTTADMLISFLCIGILGIAVVSFAATVNTYKLRVKAREQAILSEYQDVLKLEAHGYIGYANGEYELTHADRLVAVSAMDIGTNKTIATQLAKLTGAGQQVLWFSNDPSICSVDDDGTVKAKSSGSTIVRAVICDVDSTGAVAETEYVQYFPVRVGGSYDDSAWFVYVGDYYCYWLTSTDRGAQKAPVSLKSGVN